MIDNVSLPQSLAQKDLDRLGAYRENLDFYNGAQWSESARRRERRLTFNYAKIFIDKIASYLMSGISFVVDPLDDSPGEKERARKAEQALKEVYDQNNLELLDFDTEIDCAILGDAAYKVTWYPRERRVRITAPDVQGLFCYWLGDDVSRVYRVISRYSLSVEETKMLHGATLNSKQATIIEDWTDRFFTLWVDDQIRYTRRNPYGFIPFVVYPNLREPKKFWGVSDIPQIVEPQRELNRAVSQLSRILELSGNPIAVLENIESAEDIAVQPGAVWTIPEDAKAYLLDLLQGGGVKLHIDYIDILYRILHDVSESPRAAFGGMQRDLSGVALQVELYSLLQKVHRKRLIRMAAYRKRNDMILRILSQKTGEDFSGVKVRIIWGTVLPQDTLRLVQTEQAMIEAGIHSRRRAMTELGIVDPERELESWLEEERRLKEIEEKNKI